MLLNMLNQMHTVLKGCHIQLAEYQATRLIGKESGQLPDSS